jgi:8-oxo-dGTP pyrophosphatase MutT (NUDIX family)
MPISQHLKHLRDRIGHDLLMLPGVCGLIFNDRNELLLQKRSDTGQWAVIGGIVDPGEELADALVREVQEETSLIVEPLHITGVYTTPKITYSNGDQTQFVITTFRCRPVRGEPCVNDDESLDVRYFPLNALPELNPRHLERIDHALKFNGTTYFSKPK